MQTVLYGIFSILSYLDNSNNVSTHLNILQMDKEIFSSKTILTIAVLWMLMWIVFGKNYKLTFMTIKHK